MKEPRSQVNLGLDEERWAQLQILTHNANYEKEAQNSP